jgi:hypothetical protein
MAKHHPFEYAYGIDRLGCVVKTADELSICGKDGKEMLRGLLKITEVDPAYQPDPSARPIEMATLEFTPADSARRPYSVQKPYERVLNEFDAVLAEVTPDGTPWDNTRDQLLVAVLSLSDDKQKHRVPVKTTATWLETEGPHAGLYDHGYKVAEPVEVIAEVADPDTGQTRYRLRTLKTDGSGDYEYTVVNWEQINSGNLCFGERALKVRHPIRCSMALRGHFEATSDTDKDRFVGDEKQQLQREYAKRIEGMFLINGRRPDGRMPLGSLPR